MGCFVGYLSFCPHYWRNGVIYERDDWFSETTVRQNALWSFKVNIHVFSCLFVQVRCSLYWQSSFCIARIKYPCNSLRAIVRWWRSRSTKRHNNWSLQVALELLYFSWGMQYLCSCRLLDSCVIFERFDLIKIFRLCKFAIADQLNHILSPWKLID